MAKFNLSFWVVLGVVSFVVLVLLGFFKADSQAIPEQNVGSVPVCGDNVCSKGEDLGSCSDDCHAPFIQPGGNSSGSGQVIGGQTDSHGCLIGAGYSWCASRNECIRQWETNCPVLRR